jgi:DNA polymerase elongation subunit (family B)
MGSKQFLNSMYKRPKITYDEKGRRVELAPDTLIFTAIDIDTGKTELHILTNPLIDFYIATMPQPFHRISIDERLTRKITVPYKDRDKEMASALNLANEYFNSWRNRSNWQFMNQLKKNPNLYAADTQIEDYYKTKSMLEYGEVYAPAYHKGYADIEVDLTNYHEDFAYPDVAPCPIYLITYIDRTIKEVFCFILYDERIKDDIMRVINDPDRFVKKNMDEKILQENFKYHFNLYSTELSLIKSFFHTIHELKPDFVGWWNMAFDMPTILNRLRRLNCSEEDIANICCHPEVPEMFRYVNYIEDPKRSQFYGRKSKNDDDDDEEDEVKSKGKPHPSRLVDWVEIPGYTQFFDQMSTFSCLRKRSLLKSYKLNDIGKKYGGIGKLDLEDLGYFIKDVNIKNFEICLAYNIRDSYVQYAIEEKQRDINQMVAASFNTRLSKTFSNSIIIKNYLMKYLYTDSGHIMGNATSFDFKDELEGALVCRPELLEQLGIDIMGSPSYVFENAIDLDATSLYPSIIITHNIFKSALFGHVVSVERPGGESLGSGEGLFEDLQTIDQNIYEVASKYLGLPSVYDILHGIEKTATKKASENGTLVS